MDEIVKQAMAKWPNVPACYGWLGLDARGNWYLRDAQVQAQGAFATSRGSRIEHEKLIDFIGRNYLKDDDGNWFFQNGPQRVFVALENTPWIWRLRFEEGRLHMHSHTGEPLETAQIERALMDEDGCLYLQLPAGLGVVHSQDMLDAASAIEAGILSEPDAVLRDALPAQYGFERDPAPH
ncbi:DUF2946 family protein [Diaphorobacter sp.]|uniref:DUF2946 family protein n=1 Tax=Diaphorobacter sp. TaxID=1934310 RepID=UPI0028AACA6C|nr:DUF2946 family protein [Diaphorobacter sp.]